VFLCWCFSSQGILPSSKGNITEYRCHENPLLAEHPTTDNAFVLAIAHLSYRFPIALNQFNDDLGRDKSTVIGQISADTK